MANASNIPDLGAAPFFQGSYEGVRSQESQTPPASENLKAAPLPSEEDIERLLNNLAEKYDFPPSTMNRVLELLMELIPVLQRQAVAQSENMELATDLQGYYTELLTKAPFYDKKAIKDDTQRADANSKVQMAMDQIRAWRDREADKGKKAQAGVNAINDAVNQQSAEMLDSFIKMLSELTSLVTRG